MRPGGTPPAPAGSIRLALALDFAEEGWSSMDTFGEMIADGLAGRHAGAVVAAMVRPPYRRRFVRSPAPGRSARPATPTAS